MTALTVSREPFPDDLVGCRITIYGTQGIQHAIVTGVESTTCLTIRKPCATINRRLRKRHARYRRGREKVRPRMRGRR